MPDQTFDFKEPLNEYQILETLCSNGLDKDTLVIFTSDNGPWLSYKDHAGSAGVLRAGKNSVYEGGFRVSCVTWWPGKIPAGTRTGELASTIDLLPTFAHLANVPLPEKKIDGKDIAPLLFGKAGARSPHDFFYYFGGNSVRAVRKAEWKLIYPGKKGKLSLYNLDNDVSETTNVAKQYPEMVKELSAAGKAMGRKFSGPNSELRPLGSIETTKENQ